MAAVLFICALGQPLLLAHLNGFTAIGVHASQRLHRHRPAYLRLRLVCHAGMQPASHPDQLAGSARFALLGQIKALCSVPVTAARIFMIGQYLAGAELFTAPVDFTPEPHTICRSCAQRVARGITLAWCTLAARQGTTICRSCAQRVARGTTLAWCTLAALQGTPLSDAATRAFATTEMFRGPSPLCQTPPRAAFGSTLKPLRRRRA